MANLLLWQRASLLVALAVTRADRCENPHTSQASAHSSRRPAEFQAMAIYLLALGHFRFSEPSGQWHARSKTYPCFFASSRVRREVDPIGARVPFQQYSLEDLQQFRVGFFEDDGLTPVTAETRQAVRSAVDSLRRQGFRVEPFRPDTLEEARVLWWKLFVRGGAMMVDRVIAEQQSMLSPTLKDFLRIAHVRRPCLARNSSRRGRTATGFVEGSWRRCANTRVPDASMLCASVSSRRAGVEYRGPNSGLSGCDAIHAMVQSAWGTRHCPSGGTVARGSSNRNSDRRRPYEDEIVLGIAAALERDFGYLPPPLVS